MRISDNMLHRAFEPLKAVDAKTLSAIAGTLKKSRDKKQRAVGVFLDRINRYRLGDASAAPQDSRSSLDPSSGLKDLSD